MYHGIDQIDVVGYSTKLEAEVQSLQLFNDLTTKHNCNNQSSIQIPVATGGMATPHVPGAEVKDFGGTTYTVTINTSNWEAGAYLDYFLLNNINFDYKSFIQDRGLPDAIAMCADQIVVDAMNVDTRMKEIPYDANMSLRTLFAKCKTTLDAAKHDRPPVAGRKLILPVVAEEEIFNDEKFMSSLYVQHQMNSVMDGKVGRFLGFEPLFVPDRDEGGLLYQETEDGKRRYTCYAVCPGAVHLAYGFGGDRVLNKGGIIKIDDMPNRGAWFIYVPYKAGAKVVLPQRIVRFYIETAA